MTEYLVGDVARLSGVTVRTLHHYDEIGLVQPSARTTGGYRSYRDSDLERLRQVLVYRELGLPLAEIGRLLRTGDVDEVLAQQERLLVAKVERLTAVLAAVRQLREESGMTPEERLAVFGDAPIEEWEEEAAQRWGDTDTYRESRRRTAALGVEDWRRIETERSDNERQLAAALAAGEPPDGAVARQLAEQHRAHISRWFYDCSPAMHVGLGELYLADDRFRERYDAVAPGLAQYLRDAIVAAAENKPPAR